MNNNMSRQMLIFARNRWFSAIRPKFGREISTDRNIAVYPDGSSFEPKLPGIMKGLACSWPAVNDYKWSIANLKRYYGEKYFQCGSCGDSDEPIILSLNDYIAKHIAPFEHIDNVEPNHDDHNPLYLFDPTFDEDNDEILSDYTIPPIFAPSSSSASSSFIATAAVAAESAIELPEHLQSNYRWLLVGPKYSGSALHVDPLHTSAWNISVVGCKQWLVVEPLTNHGEYCDIQSPFYFDNSSVDRYGQSSDNQKIDGADRVNHDDGAMTPRIIDASLQAHNLQFWFKHCVPQIIRQLNKHQPKRKIYSFIQQPGDTVYIPSLWYHAVLNLETTVAVTHNFVWPEHVQEYIGGMKASGLLSNEDELKYRGYILDRMVVRNNIARS